VYKSFISDTYSAVPSAASFRHESSAKSSSWLSASLRHGLLNYASWILFEKADAELQCEACDRIPAGNRNPFRKRLDAPDIGV
jgi:hypothetical protein